jgi:23S rRNA pseudouridine1911/1915/1917 synthase
MTAGAPRLDVWLAADRDITRHAAQTLIDAGLVTVNGVVAKASHRIRPDDVVHMSTPAAERGGAPAATPATAVPALTVVYEDEWLAVIDKPAGIVVHPAPAHREGTLVDALKARGSTWSLLGGAERAGIVHRLDRDTSGLLVVAKTEAAHRKLAAQLQQRTLGRVYWAVVQGGFREETGSIEAPIGRDRRDRKRMAVVDGGRPAITDFRVMERLGGVSRLEVRLRTGRTHQIRVHMAYIRHPIAGDPVYGRGGAPGRPALHAAELTFMHPVDETQRTVTSPLPVDLAGYLSSLRSRGA